MYESSYPKEFCLSLTTVWLEFIDFESIKVYFIFKLREKVHLYIHTSIYTLTHQNCR